MMRRVLVMGLIKYGAQYAQPQTYNTDCYDVLDESSEEGSDAYCRAGTTDGSASSSTGFDGVDCGSNISNNQYNANDDADSVHICPPLNQPIRVRSFTCELAQFRAAFSQASAVELRPASI